MDHNLNKQYDDIDNKISFSIIIPVFNVEKYLRQCLDSIVRQTVKSFEVICINDGSTDNSLNILKEYAKKDKRFKIISQENQGQGLARNYGISIASGKYLLFVDPDDWIENNTLEIVYNKAEKLSADVVQFDYEVYNEQNKKRRLKSLYQIARKKFRYDLKKNPYYNWKTFKCDMFNGIGLYVWNKAYLTQYIKDKNIKFAPNKYGEDHIFTIKSLILTSRVYYLNSTLYHYRNRIGSSVNVASKDKFSAFENIQLLKNFLIEKDLFNSLQDEFNKYKIATLVCHYKCVPLENTQQYLDKCSN